MAYKSVSEYISAQDEPGRSILKEIRKRIGVKYPDAKEAMTYGIPTFKVDGKNLVHYASFKGHLGIYPTPEVIEHFRSELESYETAKGTIKFFFTDDVPFALIEKMVEYKYRRIAQDKKK